MFPVAFIKFNELIVAFVPVKLDTLKRVPVAFVKVNEFVKIFVPVNVVVNILSPGLNVPVGPVGPCIP